MNDVNKLFDQWSGEIHPNVFKNLRNRIQITGERHYFVGYLRIETLIESRSVYPILKELTKKNVTSNEAIDFSSIDPWIYDSELSDDFIEIIQVKELPNTERITTCHHCEGHGVLPCENCASKGSLTCLSCIGTGKLKCSTCNGSGIEVCSNCSGKGVVEVERTREWHTEDGTMHQNLVFDDIKCDTCLGKGHVPCSSCDTGFNPCYHCRGDGQTTCEICQGQGMILCDTCKGKKSLLSTINIKLKRTASEERLLLESPDFIRKFSTFNFEPKEDIWESTEARHYSEKGPLSQISLSDLLSGEFIEQHDFLKQAKTLLNSNQRIRNTERIIMQRASYVVVDFLDISYDFEGMSYSVLANTLTEQFYASENPFLSTLDGVLENARHAFEKKEYDQAERLAEQSKSDYSGTEKEEATLQLMAQIKKSKNRQITLGALIGLQALILLKYIVSVEVSKVVFDVILPFLIIIVNGVLIDMLKPSIPIKKASLRFIVGALFITILFLTLQIIMKN